ncbi:HD domain-containing protein [Desulfosporosinus sp. PR]|uniref:HD domain-containing protein n=1 Tax=Candidatus Desulfosporosinus nitrosoreducens TaxID=3401928 RepID=UPI0027FA5CAB|nr:HD domain-containing protein [Desulfosporosinus sp. PR]MDQ7093098.1 HD domain-containing protein [Desulfosporosinus sp. PR]
MNQSRLERLNSWFVHYSNDFLSGDPKTAASIQAKIDHTSRVRANALNIAVSLDLNSNDTCMAEAIGLLHDAGRFEQFMKYGTYKDIVSEDHAELGLRVLAVNQVLKELTEEEKTIVETAIRCHNKYLLPRVISDNCLVFCKLIRDADKLDIFQQFVQETAQNPGDKDGHSPEVIKSILEGNVVSFRIAKTDDDIKLMRMSWVLDINYDFTLKKLIEQRFLERMVETIEPAEDIQRVYDFLRIHLKSRLVQ